MWFFKCEIFNGSSYFHTSYKISATYFVPITIVPILCFEKQNHVWFENQNDVWKYTGWYTLTETGEELNIPVVVVNNMY